MLIQCLVTRPLYSRHVTGVRLAWHVHNQVVVTSLESIYEQTTIPLVIQFKWEFVKQIGRQLNACIIANHWITYEWHAPCFKQIRPGMRAADLLHPVFRMKYLIYVHDAGRRCTPISWWVQFPRIKCYMVCRLFKSREWSSSYIVHVVKVDISLYLEIKFLK